jgi:hypothetical protein
MYIEKAKKSYGKSWRKKTVSAKAASPASNRHIQKYRNEENNFSQLKHDNRRKLAKNPAKTDNIEKC